MVLRDNSLADLHSKKTLYNRWLKPGLFKLVLAFIALMLILAGFFIKNGAVYAGENAWTWEGISGSASAIVSNPLNPGIVYTVIDNRRLYKSIDQGNSWHEMPLLPHGGVLLNIRLAPNNDSVLFLWGYDSEGFLYRSVDGGENWQALDLAGEVAISPADWREIFLSSGGSLYKSTDGGDTWAEVSQFTETCTPPSYIAIAPSSPLTMISVFNPPSSMDFYLCKTIDGGRTWAPLSITSPVIHSVVFDPKNSSTIYLASIGGGWKSVDGGTSWQPISNGLNNPAQFVIDPDNTQVIHAADLNLPGGVFESLDGGASWTIINAGIQGLSVSTIAIGARDPLKIYAGAPSTGVWEYTHTDVQDYSITVNQGALFTNSTAVTLTLTAPPGTTQMIVSNDGGFGDDEWEVFTNTRPFTITAYGNYVIPRTVYTKFLNNGQPSGLYQDDIILDPNPPTGTVQITNTLPSLIPMVGYLSSERPATLAATNTVHLPLIYRNYLPGHRLVGLSLSASDDVSGVTGALIGTDPAFTGSEWQPYVHHKNWYVSATGFVTIYVKYRDRAGNESQVCSATIPAP